MILFDFILIVGMLPAAIRTGCADCTEQQKRSSKKVINFLRTRKPAEWKAIIHKYDPSGQFKGFN